MTRAWMMRLATVAALAFSAAPSAQAAGLFDDLARALFGGGPRLRASPIYEYDDEPRRRAPRARAPEVSSKPKPPVVQLDPQADKEWYLKDPTLRRGDIVVTAGGVLVYQGRSADAARPADFVALGGNDAKGWKQQLQTAAAGGRARFSDLSTPAKASVTAEAAE
ncbi:MULTISPECIES: hypothetical protein [Bosea]|uniref:Uncharacterized protein n=1 Tax=Bosea robiniae TaxID=1036780 RepID=A0ABY0NK96_9HYPH|nr:MULTISPECIES: hypothetical protein [Bosea]TQI75865.1 hypothetical protein FHT98_3653 [Bosea sp. AK1]SDF60860.1 hypothetical protein SAMN05421844_1011015 [Bosea robiniae]